MKIYPKSDFDKKKCRNASYEYMSNSKPVVNKDYQAKITFERKPYHLTEKERFDDRQ